MDPHLENKLTAIEARLGTIEKTVIKIRRTQRASMAMRGAYWIFIILLAFGAFYYIQPYAGKLKEVYVGTQSDVQHFNELIRQFSGEDR